MEPTGAAASAGNIHILPLNYSEAPKMASFLTALRSKPTTPAQKADDDANLKIIADDATREYNSAVFIQGGSFLSLVDFGTDRTVANNNPACFGETVALNTQLDNTQYDFKWLKEDATNNYIEIPGEVNSIYNVKSAGNYKVEATLKGTTCVSTGGIKIEYAPEILSANTSLLQCDDDTDAITVFNLTKVNDIVKNNVPEIVNKGYYESLADAKAKTNPILNPEQYTNKIVDQTKN